MEQLLEESAHEVGEKAFCDEINNNLLCPSQLYEYAELLENNVVRYVGYDEKDTYEAQEDEKTLDLLFGIKEDVIKTDEDITFEEKRDARILL